MQREDNKQKKLPLLSFATGVLSGFANGFLGAGGGIILLWALKKLNPARDTDAIRDNFATTVAVILLYSTVSAVSYSHFSKSEAAIDIKTAALLFLPAVFGGILGAHLTDRLDTKLLKALFSIIMVVAGINML